jgi:hypothetical protein
MFTSSSLSHFPLRFQPERLRLHHIFLLSNPPYLHSKYRSGTPVNVRMSSIYLEAFQYERLTQPDTIRILQLQPSLNSSSPIHGILITARLSDYNTDLIEHYVALSYVWGSLEDPQTIILNRRLFKVTRNLSNALHGLREQHRVVPLWIDAICINQDDILERNQQIQMMADIYGIARHTVIYLGGSNDKIDDVFREIALSELASKGETQRSLTDGAQRPTLNLKGMEYKQLLAEELLARPWFTRVWVFQKLVLSRDPWVQCGKSRLKWFLFCRFLRRWEANRFFHNPRPDVQNRPYELLHSLIDAQTKFHASKLKGDPRQTVIDILASRRGLGATDPRDIIFGHLGVATLPASSKIRSYRLTAPDYRKDTLQVFNEFAHDILIWSNGFEILSYVEDIDPTQRRRGLASWAPDWTANLLHSPQRINQQSIVFGKETGPWDHPIRISNDCRCLATLGEGMDVITGISRVIPWDASEIIDTGRYQKKFSTSAKVWHSSLIQDSDTANKEWQYIEPGRGRVKAAKELIYDVCDLYFEVLAQDLFTPKNMKLLLRIDCPAPVQQIHRHLCETDDESELDIPVLLFLHTFKKKNRSILSDRRIAVFKSGNYAVVPSTARIGDVISIFTRNAPKTADNERIVPTKFIFRPTDTNLYEAFLSGTRTDFGILLESRCSPRKISETVKEYQLVGESFINMRQWRLALRERQYHVMGIH